MLFAIYFSPYFIVLEYRLLFLVPKMQFTDRKWIFTTVLHVVCVTGPATATAELKHGKSLSSFFFYLFLCWGLLSRFLCPISLFCQNTCTSLILEMYPSVAELELELEDKNLLPLQLYFLSPSLSRMELGWTRNLYRDYQNDLIPNCLTFEKEKN